MGGAAKAPLWLPLDAAEATVELVGGKGASLARLAAAGLPVPSGFHVTTAAYRRFVEANDLQAAILEAAAGAIPANPASLDRASATIRGLFERGAVPAEVSTAIRDLYASLGDGQTAVAVRSSATAEDLPELSFAGQQETFLNVRGEAALLEAVRRCWASLWTARAISYRRRMGVDQRAVAMGVVVQTMVPSEVAGALFTANPTTGERDELVVNASYGLGEAVVSGQVTPDSYRLDKASLAPREVMLGAKQVAIVPADGQGTTAQVVAEDRRGEQALPDRLLHQLGRLAIEVEQVFGGTPQDIEWTVAEGRCWLLQARPMTGLPPAPLRDVRWEPPTPGSKWVRRQVVEHMPEPLSPLFEELYLRQGLEQALESILSVMALPAIIDELVDRPLFTTVNGYAYTRANLKAGWAIIPAFAAAVIRGLPMLFRRGVANWRDRALPAYLATVRRWQALTPTSASDDQLLAGVRELAWADARYWYAAALAIGVAKVSDATFDWFLSVALPGRRLTSGLFLRGFASRTLAAEAELEAIADHIRGANDLRALVAATPAHRLLEALEHSPGGRPVLASLRDYLERYGHQIYTLDFAEPTQADNPLPVLQSLRAQVRRPGRAVRARQAEVAEERDRLIERTGRSLDPLRRWLFLRLLRWAQGLGPHREEALFYVGAAWPPLRRLALELGRRLAVTGSLERPADVFFLESGQLQAASQARAAGQARPDLARLARERRALREARQRLHPPAAVPPAYRFRLGPLDLSARESQRRNVAEGASLRGFAVSPGRATAPASVILSPADFGEMAPDTILVCPTTTPAWTPLFARASGLVTDIGGVLAHGSIVAREYGIPAVMGTGSGTQRIAPGQVVTVDGDAGTVTLGPVHAGAASNGPQPDNR